MSRKFRKLSVLALFVVAVMAAACQPVAVPGSVLPPLQAVAAAESAAPAAHELSADELHYHRESVVRADLLAPAVSAAGAAPAVHELSAAELHYHRESVARRDLF